MALENKILVDKSDIITLRERVSSTPIQYPLLLDLLGSRVDDYFTNERKYGVATYSSPNSAASTVTLPDNVQFEDIVFAVGIGGYNNNSVSARSAQNIHYIYCPAIYNHWCNDTGTERDCFGFQLGTYSTTYESGIWTPRFDMGYSTKHRATLFKASGSTETSVKIGLGYYQNGVLSSSLGRIIAKNGYLGIIYRK